MNWEKLIVVEYSVSQKCFHIHDVESMIIKNLKTIMQKMEGDYLPIAIFETEQGANAFIEMVRETIEFSVENKAINDILNRHE